MEAKAFQTECERRAEEGGNMWVGTKKPRDGPEEVLGVGKWLRGQKCALRAVNASA
jgi:hypothetical protein